MPTIEIQPSSKDTWLKQIEPNNNFGASGDIRIVAQGGTGNRHRELIEFDLSSVVLPDGAVLLGAALQLYYYEFYAAPNPVGRTIWAYKLLSKDWIQGTGTNAVPTTDGARWNDPGPVPSVWNGTAAQINSRACCFYNGFIFVGTLPSGGNAYILKVNPATMATVATLAVTDYVRSLKIFGDGYLYASINDATPLELWQIDPDDLSVIDTWTGPADSNGAGDIDSDGTYIYVGSLKSSGEARVFKIDPTTMELAPAPNTWQGTAAQQWGVGLACLGGYVYYGGEQLGDNPAKIYKLDPATMDLAPEPNTWTGTAAMLKPRFIDSDGTYLYVTHHVLTSITVKINPSTMATVGSPWTGAAGQDFGERAVVDGDYLYVTCDSDPGKVVKVNRTTMVTDHVWTGGGATQTRIYDICFKDSNVAFAVVSGFIGDPGRLVRISTPLMVTANLWQTAGGDFVTTNPSGGSAVVPAAFGWMSWNVLAIVEDALAAGATTVEMLLKDGTETTSTAYGLDCRSREYGNATFRPKLVLTYGTPATVTTQDASSIADTSADGNGNITDIGEGGIDERGFEWGTVSGTYPNDVTEAGAFGAGAFSLSMTGLSAATLYFYRAKVHNTAGWSYGEERSFFTLPLPEVTTDTPSAATESTITGAGTIVTTGGDATCDKRGFVYGLTSVPANPGNVAPGASGYTSFAEDTGSFGTGAFTKLLTGLTVSRVYYLRAYIHNSDGYVYGEEVLVITNSNVNLLYPTGNYSRAVRFDTSAGGGYPHPYAGSTPHFMILRVHDSSFSPGGRWGFLSGGFIYEYNYYNENYYKDLFDLRNPLRRQEGIVKLKWKAYTLKSTYPFGKYKRELFTHSTLYTGTAAYSTIGYKCEIFYNNPNTSSPWSLSEADDLIAGVSLGQSGGFGYSCCDYLACLVLWANASASADAITNLGGSMRRLHGAVVEDEAEDCQVYFEWGETIAYGNTTSPQTKVKGESFTADVDIGALPSIHFRSVIVTACGETFYSADFTPAVGAHGNIIHKLMGGGFL